MRSDRRKKVLWVKMHCSLTAYDDAMTRDMTRDMRVNQEVRKKTEGYNNLILTMIFSDFQEPKSMYLVCRVR
jgi:hypothetical protein